MFRFLYLFWGFVYDDGGGVVVTADDVDVDVPAVVLHFVVGNCEDGLDDGAGFAGSHLSSRLGDSRYRKATPNGIKDTGR